MDEAYERFVITLWRRINRHVRGNSIHYEEIRELLFEEMMINLLERQIAAIRRGELLSPRGALEEYRREFRRQYE